MLFEDLYLFNLVTCRFGTECYTYLHNIPHYQTTTGWCVVSLPIMFVSIDLVPSVKWIYTVYHNINQLLYVIVGSQPIMFVLCGCCVNTYLHCKPHYQTTPICWVRISIYYACFLQIWCRVLHVFTQYATISNYAWMLCEGLYLQAIIVMVFTNHRRLYIICCVIGWGKCINVLSGI